MDTGLPLAGKTIVITRPERQSADICQRLNRLGAQVISFPLIAIVPPADTGGLQAQLSKLAEYDYLVFTSRNAVEMLLSPSPAAATVQQGLQAFQTIQSQPIQIAAVGKQTANALEQRGVTVSIVPDALFNSEALLEHSALQDVVTKRIGIIRGEGGRDLLRRTLLERGAKVDYIDVYRRICPVTNLLPLVKCQGQGGIDIIALTSVEGLQSLFKLGMGLDWLKQTTLLLGSQRMAEATAVVDHQGALVVADDPSDDKMVSRLLDWASSTA